jgi:hypothetical protein
MLIAAAHGDPTAFPVPLAIRLTVWSRDVVECFDLFGVVSGVCAVSCEMPVFVVMVL